MLRYVIGMDDHADQTVPLHYEIDLPFPQIDRTLVEDIEKRVVLGGGDGKFQYLADEMRHDRAAPTPLRIKVPNIGDRHIVRKIQRVKP